MQGRGWSLVSLRTSVTTERDMQDHPKSKFYLKQTKITEHESTSNGWKNFKINSSTKLNQEMKCSSLAISRSNSRNANRKLPVNSQFIGISQSLVFPQKLTASNEPIKKSIELPKRAPLDHKRSLKIKIAEGINNSTPTNNTESTKPSTRGEMTPLPNLVTGPIFERKNGRSAYSMVTGGELVKSIPSIDSLPKIRVKRTGQDKRPKSQFKSTYFKDDLFKSLTAKIERSGLEADFFNNFSKICKDLISIQEDELITQEQYCDRINLRIKLNHPESAFIHNPSKRKLLVLDLDETLIHYSKDTSKQFHHKVPYVTPSNKATVLSFNVRPFVKEFLKTVSQYFVVCVFTASDLTYAKTMVDYIDPQRQFISRIFDRRFCCITKKGFVVKDLRIFSREFPLDDILIVDNSAYCFMPQLGNGIPILPFETNMEDCELLKLSNYLQALATTDFITATNSDYFSFARYSPQSNIGDLLNLMFAGLK